MKTKHKEWRRGWDSNPRDPFGPNGFQDRRSQPLSYPSVGVSAFSLPKTVAQTLCRVHVCGWQRLVAMAHCNRQTAVPH